MSAPLPCLGLALLALACAAPGGDSTASLQASGGGERAAQDPSLTDGQLDLEELFGLSERLAAPGGTVLGWDPAGGSYLTVEEREGEEPDRIVRVDAASGKSTPLFDAEAMLRALTALPGIDEATARGWSTRTSYDLTAARDGLLLNEAGDLFFHRFGSGQAVRLTADPDEEVGETLSPDGRLLAYIHDYNLYVVPTAGGTPRALTRGGHENNLHGRLDWVYQEELYGRGNFGAFWWSPDSRRIAYLVLDETPVPEYTIVDHRERQPAVEVWRYPKAGMPNPRVRLAVVDVAGGAPVYVDLNAYGTAEFLIVRVGWTPDSKEVVFQVSDRIQTWLDLNLADPASGRVSRLFRDSTGVWIEPTDAPFWTEDGQRFAWLSERDGWRHLYLYERDGKLVRRLTEGPWEVDAVHGIDSARGALWFSGDREDVKGNQLYSVALAGGAPKRVTEAAGTHVISISPGFDFFHDAYSRAQGPGRNSLHRGDGSLVRVLGEGDPRVWKDAGLVAPEFFQLPTRDGFVMEAMLFKPAGYEPGKRYPVVQYTYSGPHAPRVRDRSLDFNLLFHQMLAQEGYLIWVCDNRSASGKGLESVKGVYENLGAQELRDLEDSLDWLIAEGYADPERIALWGWSYGGYMTGYALTHSKRWKLGIIGAPVTDWHLYDTIYTERYMSTPQANPEGYRESSVLEAAAQLSGKALIIHGVIDENVHLQNTLQLAERLQEAGRDFQLMLYPGNRHHVANPAQRRHLYGLMAEFIRTNL